MKIDGDRLRGHQLKAVDALKHIDAMCSANGISYFLIAGSALGAVRHGGVIPWDDDIDIGLTLTDFEKFKSVIKKTDLGPYKWVHIDVNPDFPRLSGNILLDQEPLITVFPIIKLSDNFIICRCQWIIRKVISPIYQLKSGNRNTNPSLKKRFAYAIGSVLGIFFSKESALKLLRWNERRFENKDTKWSINIYSKYSMKKESIKNEWIHNIIKIQFEDGEFPIFKNYDAYLSHLYGDYMIPPPEHDRNTQHSYYQL